MPHSAVPPSSQRRATNLVRTRSGSVKVKARAPLPGLFAAEFEASMGSGGPWTPNAYLSAECQTSHDLILVAWKLRSWWTRCSDPRARRRQPRGLYGRDGKRTAPKSHYRLADEPSPVIEVACSKCEWKASFSRTELLALYGAEYPLPTLLDHLANCSDSRGWQSGWCREELHAAAPAAWRQARLP
jgi:hypothetical protein